MKKNLFLLLLFLASVSLYGQVRPNDFPEDTTMVDTDAFYTQESVPGIGFQARKIAGPTIRKYVIGEQLPVNDRLITMGQMRDSISFDEYQIAYARPGGGKIIGSEKFRVIGKTKTLILGDSADVAFTSGIIPQTNALNVYAPTTGSKGVSIFSYLGPSTYGEDYNPTARLFGFNGYGHFRFSHANGDISAPTNTTVGNQLGLITFESWESSADNVVGKIEAFHTGTNSAEIRLSTKTAPGVPDPTMILTDSGYVALNSTVYPNDRMLIMRNGVMMPIDTAGLFSGSGGGGGLWADELTRIVRNGNVAVVNGVTTRITLQNDGIVRWGNTGASGYLSWDTDRAILGSSGSRDVHLYAGTTGRLEYTRDNQLKLGTSDWFTIDDISGYVPLVWFGDYVNDTIYSRSAANKPYEIRGSFDRLEFNIYENLGDNLPAGNKTTLLRLQEGNIRAEGETITRYRSNKKWHLFGDSFSNSLTSDFPADVIPKMGLDINNVVTHAVSGATMSAQAATLDALLAGDANALDTVDIITLLIGANDYAGDVALGDRSSAVNGATFAGKLKHFIETVQGANPDVELYLATPTKATGKGVFYKTANGVGDFLSDFANVISQVGYDYSVPVIDLYAQAQLNDVTIPALASDSLHVSGKGRENVADLFVEGFQNRGGVGVLFSDLSGAGGSISEPLNQIVYGTGAGVTSSQNLTFDGTDLWVGTGGVNRIRFNSGGTVRFGNNGDQGTLTWDTGKAIIGGRAGNNLSLFANNSEKSLLESSGQWTFTNYLLPSSFSGTASTILGTDATGKVITLDPSDYTGLLNTDGITFTPSDGISHRIVLSGGASDISMIQLGTGTQTVSLRSNLETHSEIRASGDFLMKSGGNVLALTLDDAQNVVVADRFGVRITPSSYTAEIQGSLGLFGGGGIYNFESNTTRNNRIVLNADANGAFIQGGFSSGGTSNVQIRDGSSNPIATFESSTGNVGIGTNNPNLDLGNGLHILASTYAALQIQRGTSTHGSIINFTDESNVLEFTIGTNFSSGGDNLVFGYGAGRTRGMIFNSDGNLTLGDLTTNVAQLTIINDNPLQEGIRVYGDNSQTADLMQFRNSSAALLLAVEADGTLELENGIRDANNSKGALNWPLVSTGTGDVVFVDPSTLGSSNIRNSSGAFDDDHTQNADGFKFHVYNADSTVLNNTRGQQVVELRLTDRAELITWDTVNNDFYGLKHIATDWFYFGGFSGNPRSSYTTQAALEIRESSSTKYLNLITNDSPLNGQNLEYVSSPVGHLEYSWGNAWVTKSGSPTATIGETKIVFSGGGTLTLPASPENGYPVRVKTISSSTIDGNGSDTIDGNLTFSTAANGSYLFEYTGGEWSIVSEYEP